MDCSLLGSSVRGVFPGKNTAEDCVTTLGDLPKPEIKPQVALVIKNPLTNVTLRVVQKFPETWRKDWIFKTETKWREHEGVRKDAGTVCHPQRMMKITKNKGERGWSRLIQVNNPQSSGHPWSLELPVDWVRFQPACSLDRSLSLDCFNKMRPFLRNTESTVYSNLCICGIKCHSGNIGYCVANQI